MKTHVQPLRSMGTKFSCVFFDPSLTSTLNPLLRSMAKSLYDDSSLCEIDALLKSGIRFDADSLETARNAALLLEKRKSELECFGVNSTAAHVEEAIPAYVEYVSSPESKKEREYMYYSGDKIPWNSEDYAKFEEALQVFKNSPMANRKIAKYMGKHIHPNHVRYAKKEMRKKEFGEGLKLKIVCKTEGSECVPYLVTGSS